MSILAFCLISNHYHLLLLQRRDEGITKFMRKLGTGYVNYFNLKYKRVGPLFQGRFKAILVDKDEYLLHLINYIHANPLKLIEPKWKVNGIKNISKSKKFLNRYRWSSYLDYIEEKNFSSVIRKDFVLAMHEDMKNYKQEFFQWIQDMDKMIFNI